jgi:transposase
VVWPDQLCFLTLIVSRFNDHLPLHRSSEIYAREGVEISRSTLVGWVGAVSDPLAALVAAIQKHILAGRKLHVDGTHARAHSRQREDQD